MIKITDESMNMIIDNFDSKRSQIFKNAGNIYDLLNSRNAFDFRERELIDYSMISEIRTEFAKLITKIYFGEFLDSCKTLGLPRSKKSFLISICI